MDTPESTRNDPETVTSETSVTSQTYNPWSVVNLVFHHLVKEGLRPVLGETGDPGFPAAGLLRALGVSPSVDGNRTVTARTGGELARLRAAFEEGHQR